MLELDRVAVRVGARLDELRAATAPRPAGPAPGAVRLPETGALARPVSLLWFGSLTGAVRALAALAGYGFEVEGTPPARPVTVVVDAVDRPLGAVLVSIGEQAGSRAGIVVRPARRLIAVVYLGRRGSPR